MLKSRKSRRNQKLKRTNTQHKQKVQVEDEPVDDEMTNISVVNTLKDGNVVIYSEVLEVETNEIDETMESRESQRIVANCAEYVDEVQIQYEPVEDGYESENDVNMAAVEAEIDLTSHVEVIKTEVDASTHADEEMLRELRDEMMEMSCGVTATELNQPRLENEGCDLHIENDDNTTTVETQMQNYIDEAKMKEFNDEILQVMGDLEKLSKMGKEKRRENHVRHLCTSHITYTMGLLECHLFWDHKMKDKPWFVHNVLHCQYCQKSFPALRALRQNIFDHPSSSINSRQNFFPHCADCGKLFELIDNYVHVIMYSIEFARFKIIPLEEKYKEWIHLILNVTNSFLALNFKGSAKYTCVCCE